ncbi:aldo/keto reductase [Rhodococcoides fascians]|uniref:aldo/keto reductase n=1 Tax=Rhodococcoides fascians TaxID=1828 RepID=UPI001E298B1F|nr:aldo/keto reductase [Rhodococcus fascians]
MGVQGLGCLGMSEFYGRPDESQSIYTVQRALDLGANLLDTSDVYGHGAGEELIGKAIADRRDSAVVSTKFGVVRLGAGVGTGIRGDAATVRSSCEDSLRRLGLEHLDVFTLTRIDPEVGIEETVGSVADLIEEGKVREIGLSEVSADTLRLAQSVAPIATLQTEWSLWSRGIEAEIVPVCRQLGIAVVPYAPLGRGFLSGRIRSRGQFGEGDIRLLLPRYLPENFATNLARVDRFGVLAEAAGATPAQWALAWLHSQGPDVIPIPGSRSTAHLDENIDASFLTLSDREIAAIENLWPVGVVAGERWTEACMSFIEN